MTQFTQPLIDQIFAGHKTQTRRPVKAGDQAWYRHDAPDVIDVVTRNGRTHWRVGQTYAICPGRGKRQVGRYRLLEIFGDEGNDVRKISHADALAEGFKCTVGFLNVWVSFYDPVMQGYDLTFGLEKTADRFLMNESFCMDLIDRPDDLYKAWALRFELMKNGA